MGLSKPKNSFSDHMEGRGKRHLTLSEQTTTIQFTLGLSCILYKKTFQPHTSRALQRYNVPKSGYFEP